MCSLYIERHFYLVCDNLFEIQCSEISDAKLCNFPTKKLISIMKVILITVAQSADKTNYLHMTQE